MGTKIIIEVDYTSNGVQEAQLIIDGITASLMEGAVPFGGEHPNGPPKLTVAPDAPNVPVVDNPDAPNQPVDDTHSQPDSGDASTMRQAN